MPLPVSVPVVQGELVLLNTPEPFDCTQPVNEVANLAMVIFPSTPTLKSLPVLPGEDEATANSFLLPEP